MSFHVELETRSSSLWLPAVHCELIFFIKPVIILQLA